MKKFVVLAMIMVLSFTLMLGCTEDTSREDLTKIESSEIEVQKDVVLKLLITNDGKEEELLNTVFEENFYPDHPNIKIEIETIPFSELDRKIVIAHTGGVFYDLIFTNHASVPTFAEGEIIANLDEYIAKSDIDFDDYNKSFLQSTRYKGSQYSMPYELDCRVLAINKKLFAEAGIEAPKTMEEMLYSAEVLTKDTDGDGKNDQFGMIMDFTNIWGSVYIEGLWLLGNGAHIYTKEGDSHVQGIDSQGMRDFLIWSKERAQYQPVDFVRYDYPKIKQAFAKGKVGMYVFGPWNYDDSILFDAEDLDYELILIPKGSVKSGSAMGGWHLSIGADSDNKDEAWEVLEFLANPKINAKSIASMPPMNEAYNYPPFNDEKYDVFLEQLKTAELPNVSILQTTKIYEKWNNYFQRFILNDLSLEETIEGAVTDIQIILDGK